MTLYEEASKVMPGGVNSPVRAFRSVGMDPLFVKKSEGRYLYGEDGRKYLDFCLSWGVHILGHNHPAVIKALKQALKNGTSFGFSHSYENRFALLIKECMPSIEKIRFVNSGTEAVLSAIRLARGFTGREKIIKFDGCYHGHSDALLVKAGSGVGEMPAASSSGIPEEVVKNTISLPYNNKELLEKIIRKNGKTTACVILEPIPANMGVVIPEEGFLEFLRKITREFDILLIFDEVISGFRAGPGGAQGLYGIRPDLTALGKIIGGGLPVGAFGGRSEIMDRLAPGGDVYQAGTLSGNPLALRAGYAAVKYLKNHPSTYKILNDLTSEFSREFRKISKYTINSIASFFTIFYTERPVNNFEDAGKQDKNAFQLFYKNLFKRCILFPPSMFEASFLSIRHRYRDLEKILKIFKESCVQ